jgi:uncharacterized protein YndB with AHSA1/START domain
MMYEPDSNTIRWCLHLDSPPHKVYRMLASDEGRARFWAESAVERDHAINFVFPNGHTWRAQILEATPHRRFVLAYYGGSIATFELESDGQGGTDLTLTDTNVAEQYHAEVLAGWVSVLLALKAAIDFDIDLRNHDLTRTWDSGYVDN